MLLFLFIWLLMFRFVEHEHLQTGVQTCVSFLVSEPGFLNVLAHSH